MRANMSSKSQPLSLIVAALIGIFAYVLFLGDVPSLLRSWSGPRTQESVLTFRVPEVDLGYAVYHASQINITKFDISEVHFDQNVSYQNVVQLYNFSNVRYAAPPTGARRFLPPHAPLTDHNNVQDNIHDDRCVQAVPKWARDLLGIEREYVGTEDCLFLDVIVPSEVFNSRERKKAPVLVWIHGGGYVAGSKWQFGSGAGLLAAAAEPIIYVTLNYRVCGLPNLRTLLT